MASASFAEGGLPRPGRVIAEAHIERLAVLALLAGSNPAPVEACRVLELGGEGGDHLLPLALAFPNSHFVAVDASPSASAGRRRAQELGLANLALWEGEIEELPESLGSFDYVLVHGTHVWASAAAREASLWTLNRRLSPSGIGYVSFNSYPGAFSASAAARLLESYLAAEGGLGSKPERIRRIAGLLAASLEPSQPLTLALKLEFDRLARLPEHDLLAALETRGLPLYFDDFTQAIAPHALDYFAEAVPGNDDVTRLSSAARDALGEFVTTSTLWQQSLDLYSARAVRHALLRRASLSVNRPPLLETMRRFVFGCAAALELRDGALRLLAPSHAVAQISEPPLSRAFVQLCRAWPEFLPFSALSELVSRDNPALRREREQALAEQLHQLFRAGIVELRLQAPRCTNRPGEQPLASVLAQRMAGAGESIVNQHQRLVHVADPNARRLLALCNGERTHEQLGAMLSGEATLDVEALLERLARLALVIA